MEAMHTLGTKYMNAFKEDLKALNILEPQHMPRASDSVYIAEDLNLIQKLLTKGLAYETDDGIYFDTEQFTNYGALPGLPKKEDLVATPHPNKKNSRDFSLWKKNSEYGFESPYGKGFPGWHIECSAMSMRTLQTETLDIHTGGIDLAPIHHNNEIAQSEGATGKKFANFFMHSAFVDFEGGKMAKSEGNVVRLRDILKEKRHPSALRYLFLSAHYRTPVDFSFNSLNAAHVGIEGLLQQLTTFTDSPVEEDLIIGINQEFQAAIEDDLNTAKAISLIPKVLTGNYSGGTKKHILFEWDKILGLNLHYLMQEMKNIDEEINNKIKEREQARNLEDFDKADKIRKEIIELGYSLLDTGKETIALKTLALLTPSTE
jgi:cysteinyl-tRNA synthetase